MRTERYRGLAFCALVLVAGLAFAQDDTSVTHLLDSGGRMPLNTVVPVYPEKARRERVEGDVQVCFNVDHEGRTSRVRVRRSSNRIFERPAILAARASTYLPVPRDKILSGIKTCRTFRFRLLPVAIDKLDGSED
ncbi:MAG: TonB family protein [Woeseiaceae bacterium]|nr:TonB family protein [Woeseiaceae bacterium]